MKGRLPTFVVIGAMKSGTTSLYQYLRAHPEVFMPTQKELNFFFDVEIGTWEKGLDWYLSHFQAAGGATAVGEASPGYTRYPAIPDVPKRMASVMPHARLLYVVRHPIERMCSHYRQNLDYEDERRPMGAALLEDPHYLACSRYALQLEQFAEHFPREQFLVLTSERLRSHRAETVAGVLEFIGVDPGILPANLGVQAHEGTGDRARRPAARALRRLPGHAAIGQLAPLRAKAAYRRLISRPRPPEYSRISADERAELVRRVTPDIERLRLWLGNAVDDWDLLATTG